MLLGNKKIMRETERQRDRETERQRQRQRERERESPRDMFSSLTYKPISGNNDAAADFFSVELVF